MPISKQTSLKTTSTDKLNLRLVRASQYLSVFNIELRYKAGKSNIVPNALLRLAAKPGVSEEAAADKNNGILDILYRSAEPELIKNAVSAFVPIPAPVPAVYHATLVKMADNFKDRLKTEYLADE